MLPLPRNQHCSGLQNTQICLRLCAGGNLAHIPCVFKIRRAGMPHAMYRLQAHLMWDEIDDDESETVSPQEMMASMRSMPKLDWMMQKMKGRSNVCATKRHGSAVGPSGSTTV